MSTNKYYWVVTYNNETFHREKNPFAGHRIPLAETDPHAAHPDAVGRLSVRCDECGNEYSYEAQDVILWNGTPPLFTPHPKFIASRSARGSQS
jgi:hypothetical protein